MQERQFIMDPDRNTSFDFLLAWKTAGGRVPKGERGRPLFWPDLVELAAARLCELVLCSSR